MKIYFPPNYRFWKHEIVTGLVRHNTDTYDTQKRNSTKCKCKHPYWEGKHIGISYKKFTKYSSHTLRTSSYNTHSWRRTNSVYVNSQVLQYTYLPKCSESNFVREQIRTKFNTYMLKHSCHQIACSNKKDYTVKLKFQYIFTAEITWNSLKIKNCKLYSTNKLTFVTMRTILKLEWVS